MFELFILLGEIVVLHTVRGALALEQGGEGREGGGEVGREGGGGEGGEGGGEERETGGGILWV